MKLSRSTLGAVLLVSLGSAGCVGISVDNGKVVSDFSISPIKDTLGSGTTFQFSAVLAYADGTTRDVSDNANTVWNTSDASVATVSSTGMVTALKPGVVDILAAYNDEKANEHFLVTP